MSTFSFEDAKKAPAPAAGVDTEQKKGFSFEEASGEPPARGFGGAARDLAGVAINTAIGVPEAAVGMADMVTNLGATALGFESPQIGKRVEDAGIRFREAKEFVNENIKSDASRDNRRKFQEAEGIGGKFKVAIENPSLIAEGIGESLGAMGAGGVVARGLMGATRLGQMGAKGAAVAGAVGEGTMMAGSQAEAIRQETEDGLLTPGQAGAALATGGIGGAFGFMGGRLANKLGIGDADTMMAQGTKGIAKQNADEAAAAAANPLAQQAAKGIPRQVVEGAISEGFLEELPQSMAETIIKNLALDKPWTEGLDEAIVMGVLSGGAMGGAAAGYKGMTAPKAQKDENPNAPAPTADAGAPAGEPQAPAGPGTQRMRNAFAEQLAAERAAGTPAPVLNEDVMLQNGIAPQASINQDQIGKWLSEPQRPSEAMGLRADAGGLEGAAALAVDSGASPAVQPQQYIDPADLPDAGSDAPYVPAPAQAAAQPAIQSFDYLSASPEDRARYDALIDAEAEEWENMRANAPMEAFASLDALDESDLQSFNQASNVTNEEFLRAMGASDEEINDAIATTNQPRGAQGSAAGASQTQANDAGSTGARAGQGQSTSQVTQPAQDIGARIAQLDAEADAADAEARDWASRKYKANGKDLPEYAAQGGPADVGEANEQRRLKAIADAKGRAAAARAEAQALRDQGNAQAQQAAKAPTATQAAPQAAPTPAPKAASVADLAAISRKQIPDMTDSELVALASATATTHSRYQKLQKAIQTRGLQAQAATNQGAQGNGAQTPQAQQASTQQPAAGAAAGQAVNRVPAATAAQAAGTAAKQGAVNGGATTGNNGPQASQQGAAGSQEAIAAIAQEGNARREAERTRKLEASERWTRMTTAERQAAATNAKGLNAIQKKNVHTKPWADLSEKVRAALLDVVAPVEQPTSATANLMQAAQSSGKLVMATVGDKKPATTNEQQPPKSSRRLSVWDEAAQDDNAATLNRVQELVDSGRMGLDEANATVERAIRASTIARDKGIVADYLGEAVARKTGAAYDYASTIDQFDGLEGMSLKDARAEHAKRMAARDAQTNAPAIEAAAAQAATSPTNDTPAPTEAQKEAGNYKKGHVRLHGLEIAIENPAGTQRNPAWPALKNHYGYFKGSVGADKDHVDVFLTDKAEDASLPVFVVDQKHRNGKFDEHKVIMGAANEAEARQTYLQNYEQGWTGLDAITEMSLEDFKAWVMDASKTTKPAAESAAQVGEQLENELQKAKERMQRIKREKGEASIEYKAAEARVRKMRQGIFDAEDALQAATAGDPAAIAKIEAAGFGLTAEKLREATPSTKPEKAATPDKAVYGAKNTLVSQSRADELRAKLREKAKNNMFGGLDTEMLAWGTELAVFHLEAGVRKFADFAAAMASDLGTTPAKLRPYLRSWYNGARDMMEDHGLSIDGMDSTDTVRNELAKLDAATAADEKAPENVAKKPLAKTIAAETKADGTTLAQKFAAAISAGSMPGNNHALKQLVQVFDGEAPTPARMKEAQEQMEVAIAMAARRIVAEGKGDRATFDELLQLYQSQPNLNIRTSTSVANQAYSTPAPLSFLASRLAGITSRDVVHEPTAGTGLLLIAADPKKSLVNELNDLRVQALKEQGFAPTQKDAAAELLVPEGTQPDAVITNPPFGSVKDANDKPIKVKVDGYNIGQIDHLIAARALQSMKDDGRATLILGANKVPGGLSTDDRIFFNWLYSHYNVTGHFEISGDLYTRQGAQWPVRVISINGRQSSSKIAPVAGTVERANNWEQVYEYFAKSLAQPASTTQQPAAAPAAAGGREPETSAPRVGNVARAPARAVPDSPAAPTERVGSGADEQRLNAQPYVPQPPASTSNAGAGVAGGSAGAAALTGAPTEAANEFQAPYTPRSARKDEGVLIPSNMTTPVQEALSRLEDEVGDIDEFARKELGYDTVQDLHNALMGLQVDSVATAIYQMKKGKAVVIADQTGIGKGRQAASVIRWAVRQGMTPVFMSVKPSLFTDMYGDLADIGTNDVVPLIFNVDQWVAGKDGEQLFKNKPALHKRKLEQIASTGKLPDGTNAVFLTYSQINVANTQRQALQALAPNAIFVLDESHNAAGESATGEFVISTLELAKGVTYLSATYAKRPDNMPLYFKTDIGDAMADANGLSEAMAAGGLPLQTVVSNNLVKAGQMFRRERSYNGVSIASVFDTANRVQHERLSDKATEALRAIVSADRMFHEVFVKNMAKQLKEEGGDVIDNAGNQVSASVQHTEFSSVVHNFVKQMLLGLKAQSAADEAIASLKRGEKPVIAVENTMGSFLMEYAENNALSQGDSLGVFDYRNVLSRALERSRVVTVVAPNGEKSKKVIPLKKLDARTLAAYDGAQKVIDKLVLDIPVSPIDWMRAEITRAGYSVAEITGRKLAVDYTDPGKPLLSAIDLTEQQDKVSTTRKFNGGQLDALILNVAGSTGISLHASERFADQRQRHMIVAQPAGDINIFMQMLGRIHRTGQVRLPKYSILSVDLPTEKRPTAVLAVKMKSLNANTSSNTESATSVKSVDILNKYGDQVVHQYLADNWQLAGALGVLSDVSGESPEPDIARKATGRLALQPIEVQKAFYDDVEGQYNGLIEYLNKTNQNDLEPRTFDYDAKELRQETLFEGPDPSTPFGEDAIYGEYSIKAQGTPMKPDEITSAMAENLNGASGAQHGEALIQGLMQTYVDQLNAVREKNGLGARVFDAEKYESFTKGLFGEATAAQMVENARQIYEAGQVPAPFTVNDVPAMMGVSNGLAFIREHTIGKTFRVEINSETYNAIVTNIRSTHKATGNPFSLSKVQVSVAVNGSLRSLTVPATQFQKIVVSPLSSGYTVKQLFAEQPANQRETAKIVTGNLLAAYGELQGVRGSIISFTKQDGTTEQGILLPKAFDYTKNTRGDYRLESGAAALNFLQKSDNRDIGRFGITTRDGVVRVLPAGQGIRVQVPKSKAKGGKYFLDKQLIAIAGDFVTAGQSMVATVYEPKEAVQLLDALMKKQALYALPSMADEAKELSKSFVQGNEDVRFSRNGGAASSRSRQDAMTQTTQVADAIRAAWGNGPEVVVAYDMQDPAIPAEVRAADLRQRSGGAVGEPEGFYYKGKVYVLASQMRTANDVARVVAHEVLGHYGLRGMFGKHLGSILDQLATMRRAEVAAKIKEYGLSDDAKGRREAAEEVLSVMAQTTPKQGFVTRAVAAIRTWLRANVPGFQSLRVSDAEIIRDYILPARAWVERGGPDGNGPRGGQRIEPVMSRAEAGSTTDQTQTANFKRWYGDWQNAGQGAASNDSTNLDARGNQDIDPLQRHRGVGANPDGATRVGDFTFPGASGPVGRDGAPARFFHGTRDDFTTFDGRAATRKDNGWLGAGFYFTSNADDAAYYSGAKAGVVGRNVMPVYVAVRNPYVATPAEKAEQKSWSRERLQQRTQELQAQGYDGVVMAAEDGTIELVAFQDTQIKSAIGNNGDFDPANPDIRFSRAKMAELKDKGLQMAHTYMTHPGKVSLWDKTVGTMRHVAERYPAFKPVFEAAQQFIDDVASVANQAAQYAPRLIPRVETLSDLRKKPISVVDNRAIGKALFGGTLDWGRDQHGKAMPLEELKAKYAGLTVDQKAEVLLAAKKVDPRVMAMWRGKQLEQFEALINSKFDSSILKAGVAFNHKELRDFFGMNEQQISLYDEARATVDKSLDITARAEMLRALGRDWDGFRDMVMDAPTLTDAWKLLDDELEQRAKAIPDSRDQMAAKMFQIRASHDKARELMDSGYMPLQRFGKYTVDVVDADGERIYFGMFESKADSNRMAETMKRDYQDASVTQGTLNDQQYKLFAGITPETAELFGTMLGLDAAGNDAKDQAFQEFLKLSKNNHSALKRLIHRKGIAGYSEDVGRVLASFVYSNARLAATGLNAGKMENAINDLNTKHKQEGELGEIAAKLREYIQDPQEEGQAIRGMLFAQYLGGSIASAMVNMTQPFAVTLPWLSQFGGMAKASRYLSGALKDMATRGFKYDSELAHALKMAEDDGVVSPQEIHQLMAQARGAGGLRTGDGTKTGDARANAANVWEKVKVGWGQPFALAEQFNRRSTFIAAFRLAKEQGKTNPAEFARRAVVETQFLYTKANKPQWARGAIGGTLFTFKTYSVSFLELMQRTWNAGEAGSPERAAGRRAVGWAMLMLMLMGGAGGLPFVEDVEDLVDGAGQMMGYNTSVKQWRQQAMRDVLGAELADFLESGLSGLPGMPLDVSGRLGMGNLIPGTGLLLDKQSNARDVVELLGPAGDLVQRGLQGTKEIIKGAINADGTQMVRGAGQWAPNAVRNLAKGADMAVSGMYKDSKGYKVIDTTLDEAILKAIGFQPRSVAEVQESNSFMQRSKSFYIQTSSDIKAKWAQALFDKDAAGVERARERVQEWNRKNPDQPIRINMPDIWKRVAQMGKDRTDRIADTAPKALRQQLRDMAQEQSR